MTTEAPASNAGRPRLWLPKMPTAAAARPASAALSSAITVYSVGSLLVLSDAQNGASPIDRLNWRTAIARLVPSKTAAAARIA